ncbi:MAG TPA: tail fiber domain-containing protein, partial [Prolixibacteraceae bacterium]|nr:tail fiber domain-containing protein [Prolixibacteraceae bacterium]
MKKSVKQSCVKVLFIIVCLLTTASFSSAQIKVDSDGRIGLHSTTTSTTCNIWLRGLTILQNDYDGKIIFGNEYSNPEFYPGTTNTGKIGKINNQFGEIRGQYHYATATLLTSDKRLKENFRTIDQPLVKILKLNGKKYDYISESSDTIGTAWEKEKKAQLKKDKLGFVAQEVLDILPEAVFYDKEADRYYIEYNAIIPVIVEAMKEQQATIENLT